MVFERFDFISRIRIALLEQKDEFHTFESDF